MSDETRRAEWPVLTMGRTDLTDLAGDYFALYSNEVDEYETERYFPASHPLVLSDDEAGELVAALHELLDGHEGHDPVRPIFDRLETYAKGDGQ